MTISPEIPIHLVTAYPEKENFFQSYMYHVPSGGLFITLGDETALPLRSMDTRELLGRTVEVSIHIQKPFLEVGFRGAITFAAPFEPGQTTRRIGIEFFRYENSKKNFLLDQLNALSETAQIPKRQAPRFPARLRVQFFAQMGKTAQPNLNIRSVTEEISLTGCSFHSVRAFEPGRKLRLKIHIPEQGSDLHTSQSLEVVGTVRWNNTDFSSRLIGIEFNLSDPNNPNAKAARQKLSEVVGHLQKEIETELLARRIPADWF